MAISSTPSHTEIQNEFTNGNDSTSLRSMLNTVFGSATGNMKKFAGAQRTDGSTQNGAAVTDITDSQGVVYGNIFESAGVGDIDVQFRFRYGNPSFGYQNTQPTPIFGTYTGEVSKTLTGLPADSNIEYRLQHYDPFQGWVDGPDPSGFNTDPVAEPRNFINGVVDSNCTSTFTWDHPTTGAPANYQYRTRWNNTAYSGWNTMSGGSTSMTFAGQDGDILTVQLRAENQYGYTSTSVQASVNYFCGGGDCLVAGTPITMYNGEQVAIEQLVAGDALLAADIAGFEDTNNVNELYSWNGTDINKKDVKTIVKEVTESVMPSTVKINGGLLEASNPHSQLIERDGIWKFIPIEHIEVGDTLIDRNGEETKVDSVEVIEEPTTVYKMTLEEPYHTFYANNILTHNIKII